MQKITLPTIAFIIFHCSSSLAGNVEIIDQNIVNDLTAVQKEVDSISARIMSCMDAGKQHKECICQSEAKFSQFSKMVKALFERYPELEDYDLIHYRTPDGAINNQSLIGITRQASMQLTCE